MREYFRGFIETIAQRLIRVAMGRAIEIVEEVERTRTVPSTLPKPEWPAIEYLQ